MADFRISVGKGKVGASPSGVVSYIRKHLESPEEGGCFAEAALSKSPGGSLSPHLWNYPLWRQVGLEPGDGPINDQLLRNLTMGLDFSGETLSTVEFFRPPVEILIAFPCELSMALEHDPHAALMIQGAAAAACCRELERYATTVRVGQRQTEVRAARIMALYYMHAHNKRWEPHQHPHILVFPSALGLDGRWRAYTNREFMQALHTPDGVRRKVTDAAILEAERHGYLVELAPGKSDPDYPHGAWVTCPDGVVIHPGSVPRTQGALMHARRALWLQLGSAPLTQKELSRVLDQEGQVPVAGAGGQCQEVFETKLECLHLLDGEGRIKQDLRPALAEIDAAMAVVQASLRDLPFLDAATASEAVRARRDELQDQVPEIATDDWTARQIWTLRLDALLDLVGSGTYDWWSLSTATRNDLYLLAQAGVVKKHWDNDLPEFRLTKKGEARRASGLQEVEDIKAAVPHLIAEVCEGKPSPEVVLGRLHSAGVRVRGASLEFRRLGRVVDAPEALFSAGITETTKVAPDMAWWQRYWRRRRELPEVLARVMLRPEEVPPEWFPGLRDRVWRPEPPEKVQPRIYDMNRDKAEMLQEKKQVTHKQTHNLNPERRVPIKDHPRDRQR